MALNHIVTWQEYACDFFDRSVSLHFVNHRSVLEDSVAHVMFNNFTFQQLLMLSHQSFTLED